MAASELADHIFKIIDRLAQNELDGPEQTLVSGEVVQSWPVPPVRIYYQRRAGAFWVLRIYHQAQAPIAR